MMVPAYNPNTKDREAGRSQMLDQIGLHSKIRFQRDRSQKKKKKGQVTREWHRLGRTYNGQHETDDNIE